MIPSSKCRPRNSAGRCLVKVSPYQIGPRCLQQSPYASFSPNGRWIVTANWDHTARVWNATDGKYLRTLHGHADYINTAVFSPDSQRILTSSGDHTARVWSAADGHLLTALEGHSENVQEAAFSADGSWILTSSYDKTSRVWESATGQLIAKLGG